ncbi:hypothetical protein PGT21_028290 [Puccinia graminis f. sp. tritici]|uniref:Uncharacterized protein n=1 Tax=Puccinia graminis f. sp. tritici TaxID=56615 RepID=A0A5B0QP88_PUCGR|nr:hypothetical protein PGT21_028290 [Puccinia graminis f. sp. tritici]
MRSQLLSETGMDVSTRTVERYLRVLGLKQRQNDLADGKITREGVVEHIRHARDALLANSAGYRRMRQILVTNYGLHVPRWYMTFSKSWILKEWKCALKRHAKEESSGPLVPITSGLRMGTTN